MLTFFQRALSTAIPALAALVFLTVSSASAQCVKEEQQKDFGAGSASIVSLLCKPEGAESAAVRVTFHRLSEPAAGGLLLGSPWPELSKITGDVRVVDNGVTKEATALFKNFGTTEDRQDVFYMQATSADALKEADRVKAADGRRSLTYLSFPDPAGFPAQDMAMPDIDNQIAGSKTWPKGFNFYYHGDGCEKDPSDLACVTLWRYLSAEDIDLFKPRYLKKQELLKRDIPEAGEKTPLIPGEKPLALIKHLTKAQQAPEDFALLTGKLNDCGDGFEFAYFPRKLMLDAAIIENVSGEAINIDGLLGTQVEDSGLRPPAPPMRGVVAAGVVPIPGKVGTLAPGERALIPLKMTFVAPKGLGQVFAGNLLKARKIHKAIEKLEAGTLLKSPDAGEGMEGKAKESFGPPSLPRVTPYMWGPELTLKGLTLGGKRIILEEAGANFLELSASEGKGSCPFLYSYDERKSTWVSHGKVIDGADTAEKEMTQDIDLEAFATRFRLAEEELEMTQINRVTLTVTLDSGETSGLLPDDLRLKEKDARYVPVMSGREITINFRLPPGIRQEQVTKSALSITGYYRRYSSMNVVDMRPNDEQPVSKEEKSPLPGPVDPVE